MRLLYYSHRQKLRIFVCLDLLSSQSLWYDPEFHSVSHCYLSKLDIHRVNAETAPLSNNYLHTLYHSWRYKSVKQQQTLNFPLDITWHWFLRMQTQLYQRLTRFLSKRRKELLVGSFDIRVRLFPVCHGLMCTPSENHLRSMDYSFDLTMALLKEGLKIYGQCLLNLEQIGKLNLSGHILPKSREHKATRMYFTRLDSKVDVYLLTDWLWFVICLL